MYVVNCISSNTVAGREITRPVIRDFLLLFICKDPWLFPTCSYPVRPSEQLSGCLCWRGLDREAHQASATLDYSMTRSLQTRWSTGWVCRSVSSYSSRGLGAREAHILPWSHKRAWLALEARGVNRPIWWRKASTQLKDGQKVTWPGACRPVTPPLLLHSCLDG